MKLNQKNINDFLTTQKIFSEALNHRMTNIEGDVKWMRRIGYYMATILTVIGVKLLI